MTARSNPLAWPWPADTPLDRARRVAQSYRDALRRSDPDAAHALDTWAADHGQGWVRPQAWDYDENELLTLYEAAERASVRLRTIYQWHQRGLVYVDTVDGRRVRVGDLVRFIRDRRRSRLGDTTL
jgi:hypothetical protein